jgi:DNA-binding response OmpR family regulator
LPDKISHHSNGETNGDSKSVLVVEDDEQISALIGAYAEICGMHHQHAYNGHAAITEARRHIPQAVILDLMLPDIDGFEVCRQLRANRDTAHTPIIILSALGGEADRQRGRDCGANRHLTKPFDPDEFMRVLKSEAGRAPLG